MIQPGECECGCGLPTTIAPTTDRKWGAVKGEPRRFVVGHGNVKHGHHRASTPTPTYRSWKAMLDRCMNPNATGFENYGGRGVKVCARWSGLDGFARFLADMGERPAGLSLDRAATDGHYEPSNCRWASASVQAQNRRPLAAWSRKHGACTECGTTDRRHIAKGLCSTCYRRGFPDHH